ncbi:nickel pincer cofactor biosynthesis protein LarB [Pseudoramibacter sp.]|jgi:NCAIR mutase (PurE)-related protein|uniref:nickel pincer cofactor biosynthesis protein LarB n=1 Tax=Pseudoramibacter sp. TaxID=2034862 RepID=UPI0025E8D87E|nr:nickel pincer cofactor biosynthesis protein LarB [Pseudoramibacter sp.]MCH4072623.1 nickel pincer cofactor biosynthesis protein LarB [Pseudoramibacter sp.]MCH4106394.1 nickel pincer cofactor biosynthesis protein LarB [Pseudoramibacter sp.]
MDQREIYRLLEQVKSGKVSVEQAVLDLKEAPYQDIGYAKIDTHRGLRQGIPEVIYGAGKTADQIIGIVSKMLEHHQDHIMVTSIDSAKAKQVQQAVQNVPVHYHALANFLQIGDFPPDNGSGYVLVVTGGTSDLPVSEEAALTAQMLGNDVRRLYDVGVSGLHRLLDHMDDIMCARVIVAVAGMEGALASVVGGMADCPVVAVPTSVGYGASFGGVSALLSMLNSCASGVSVVNIDNGFGAGYLASMINHI